MTKRQIQARARAAAVLTFLLTELGATTSYNEPVTPRTPRYRESTVLYGWLLTLQPKQGAILDADGKPTQFELVRAWTHKPGDIVNSRDGKSRYMVRQDHSLRKI